MRLTYAKQNRSYSEDKILKKERISYFLNNVSQSLDKYIGSYDNTLLLGDYNSEITEEKMIDFCDTYDLV